MVGDRLVYDAHAHIHGLLSSVPGGLGGDPPPDTPFATFDEVGLDGCIVCVVGDPATFGVGTNDTDAVRRQLAQVRSAAAEASVEVVDSADGFDAARSTGRPALMLGVEGADCIGTDLDALADLRQLGVRLLGLMHYAQNAAGTISMDLRGVTPGVDGERGLTSFGRQLVGLANELGIIVDVTHAHDETVRDVLDCSTRPVICSHTGVRSYQEFARYISDELAGAIVRGGGLIGMWPCRIGPYGPRTVADFAEMVAHCAQRYGVGALTLGTDFNGAPAYADGYRGPVDNALLIEELSRVGFHPDELDAVFGANLLRFLGAYCS